jgi:hypothetical protein
MVFAPHMSACGGKAETSGLQSKMSAYDPKRSCAETALVERPTESRDSDSHRNQHQHKHRDRIVVQIGKV